MVLVRSFIAAPQECRQAGTAGRSVHRRAVVLPTPHPSGMVFGAAMGLMHRLMCGQDGGPEVQT